MSIISGTVKKKKPIVLHSEILPFFNFLMGDFILRPKPSEFYCVCARMFLLCPPLNRQTGGKCQCGVLLMYGFSVHFTTGRSGPKDKKQLKIKISRARAPSAPPLDHDTLLIHGSSRSRTRQFRKIIINLCTTKC